MPTEPERVIQIQASYDSSDVRTWVYLLTNRGRLFVTADPGQHTTPSDWDAINGPIAGGPLGT